MNTDDALSEAVTGYALSMQRLCAATPAGSTERAGHVRLLFSGTALPSLNSVAVLDDEWEAGDVTALAEHAEGLGLPWSILFRVARDTANESRLAEIAEIAGSHGLTGRSETPFLTCDRDDLVRRGPRADSRIVTADATDWAEYTATLSDGFEAPPSAFGSLMAGGVLDVPEFTGYLARLDGQPAATGLGSRIGQSLGVFNIAVVPRFRRAGLGRAVTERVVLDGFEAGATIAYLQASDDGRPLYESMGFRHVETWISFRG